MNIRVESAGQCRKNVFVEVPADLVKNEFGEVVQAYSQYAKIPGFRPGRAPRDLVRKRFAKEIAQEVKERLVPRAYQEAVKQQNIQTVAVLDVKEDPIEDGQPFSFTVVVDVTPEFPLPDYKGLKIEGKKIEISEEDVDSTIKRLQDQGGRYDDVTGRAVQTGDLVQVDYEGTIDGQPVETTGFDPLYVDLIFSKTPIVPEGDGALPLKAIPPEPRTDAPAMDGAGMGAAPSAPPGGVK